MAETGDRDPGVIPGVGWRNGEICLGVVEGVFPPSGKAPW
jgi:hypothetical protein